MAEAIPVPGTTPVWYPLKLWTPEKGFALPVQELINAQIKDNQISKWNLISTLASVSMVEAGYVPVLPSTKEPSCTVEDLMRMSVADRYLKLMKVLAIVLRENGDLRNTQYKLILPFHSADINSTDSSLQTPHQLPNEENIQYEYSLFLANLWTLFDKNLILMLTSYKFDVFEEFAADNYLPLSDQEKEQFLLYTTVKDKLEVVRFVNDFKYNVAYLLIDKWDACCPEIRILDQVPTEMILEISKYLDMRSCVKFGMTCRRINDVLNNNDEVWKRHLQHIPRDFPAYGLPVPDNIAPQTVREEDKSYKVEYQERYSAGRDANRYRRDEPFYPRRDERDEQYYRYQVVANFLGRYRDV